jgi:ribosome maturation factor RimP
MKKKKSAKTGYQQYEERAEAIAAPIAEQFGIRIYDVEYVREGEEFFLNVYIDKDGGVTIGDCENVSRLLSDALDKDDPIKDPYTLIVSSPGLGRALTKDRHLQQSIGQDVEIHLYKPHQETGEKDIRGELLEFDEAQIILSADPPVPAKGKGKSRKKKKGAAVSETAQDKAADAESDEMTAAETSAQTETDDKTGDAQNARQRLSVARKEIASIRLAFDFE